MAIMLVMLIWSCGNSDQSSGSMDDNSDSLIMPDSETGKAKIYLYHRDRVTAEIYSTRFYNFDAKDSTMAYDLDINILDTLGAVTNRIVGDSGIIRDVEKVVHIYSNVIATINDTTRLETDYLWWNSKTNRIKSDAFVRIIRGDVTFSGWGLDADNQLNRFKILDQVSGEVADPS